MTSGQARYVAAKSAPASAGLAAAARLRGTDVKLASAGLSTSVKVTGGYTPNDRWTVTREGRLPGLSSRRAEVVGTAPTQLALQATSSG